MRKSLKLLIFTLLAISTTADAQSIKALFNYKTFYAPGQGPYLETYISVRSSSVEYSKLNNGKFQGTVEVSLSLSDATGIKYSDKYNLLSPEVDDTTNNHFNFIDQHRVQLPNGKYLLELTLKDKNHPEKPQQLKQPLQIEYYPNLISVSDISLIESYQKTIQENMFSKSGYDMVPYVDNYFSPVHKKITFYAEVYNTDKVFSDAPFLVSYFIKSAESGSIIENLRSFKKETPAPVRVIFSEIPIHELGSGNYLLIVEVRNQQNELVATRETGFQRNNQLQSASSTQKVDLSNSFVSFYSNKDTLSEYIRCLRPIASPLENTFLDNQLKLADTKLMQRFFYDFWNDRNPTNPEKAWLDYKAEVKKVNNEYSTSMEKGYDTDRGRVYLQYGPPNTINKSYNEPSAYPYEIWHFYRIGQQTNRKFIFFNQDLVSNDFVLLHSDAQGEITDSQWEMRLHKRDTQTNDFDEEEKGDYFGNKARDTFTNPK